MSPAFEDHFIQVGQYRTRYWQVGNTGTPVILVHGLNGSVEYWQKTIKALASNHRVFALDLLGFGQADKPALEYTMDYFADFLRDFADALQIEVFHLVGHSLGGGISLVFTGKYRAYVDKLVIVCGAGLSRKVPLLFRMMTLPWVGDMIATPTREGMKKGLKTITEQKHKITNTLIDTLSTYAASPGGKAALLSTLRSNMNWSGIPEEVIQDNLAKIQQQQTPPALVIWGKQDSLLPFADAEPMLAKFPETKICLLDNCGHIPQLEHPAKFNQALSEFLK